MKRKELKYILERLRDFSALSEKEQKELQNALLEYTSGNREEFMSEIRSMQPSLDSVAFEVYEALGEQPEEWVDFLVSEFERIQQLAENAGKQDEFLITSPLDAYCLFVGKEFAGNEKLLKTVMQGTHSSSYRMVLVSILLLTEIYESNKEKYRECKTRLQECLKSEDRRIAKRASQMLIELEGETKENRIKSESIFAKIANCFSYVFQVYSGKNQ